MNTIIKSGTLISASETFQADILIQDEKISQIGMDLQFPQAQVIDASGMFVLPGGVDPHTHFDLPMFNTVSSDDHYSGHKAAAFGGTTTVIDFVSHDFPTLAESVERWHQKADHKAAIDFGFHMNVTHWDEKIAAEIPLLVNLGITTVKVFTAYNDRLRLKDDEIFKVLRIAKQHGMLTLIHAENGDVIETMIQEALQAGHTSPEWHARTRPAWGAVEATFRAASLAAQADAPAYIVHMNAAGEADQLAYARRKGIAVMGETCPQYLFFTEDDLRRPDGAKWICSPPVRTGEDNERLWQALADNTLQVIGTDHCPFFYDGTQPILYEGQPVAIPGKELGKQNFTLIPNGLPAVGDRLPILWSYGVGEGRITPNQFVALTSTNPAKIFGLYPQKGSLSPGSDADLVIWDPQRKITYGVAHAQHRTDYNLFEGWHLTGYPDKVFLRGKLIVDHEQWLGQAGQGKFLHRQPGAPVL
ncbi:MAG TPA: dihydropyrimidinase [Anaerolineales bacterium]|nr:dihydropyrimidinase [Anaerolineales bacterium]